MANDAINEMISAFALGCMDRKNYKQFKNYIRSNGELPKGELGDAQNIISLIPTLLDISAPRDGLKNVLGNRLIEFQKKINNGEIENRRETRIIAEDSFLQRSSSTVVFDVDGRREGFLRDSKLGNSTPTPPTRIKTKPSNGKKTIVQTDKTAKHSSLSIILLWIFSSLLLIAIVVLSYFYLDKIDSLAEENAHLKSQVIKLRSDLTKTNSFVTKNKEFVDFFNNPNIRIIQLKGIGETASVSGKLLLSFDVGEGLLQLNNMPRLDTDKVFQLWLVSEGGTFSVGAFEITPDKKYIKFSNIPFVMEEDIRLFRITQEKRGEREMPRGSTILFGSLQNER